MGEAWSKSSTNFNRYIQRLRRLHTGNSVHYLRTIEAHNDLYPHWHIVLQFHSPISVNDARYFDNVLYREWKQLWPLGLSDYQPPLTRLNPVIYIIKYISKNSHTSKTIWKKLYANVTAIPDSNSTSKTKLHLAPDVQEIIINHSLELCKKYKIKQCTWSRGFKFPCLPMARRPETEQQTL